MRVQGGLILSLAASAAAFPSMASQEQLEEYMRRSAAPEAAPAAEPEPQILGTVLGSLTNTIGGLLGSVASAVDPANKRPEPGYQFQAPGPGDSRGPCPGLNLLANYGYLPRNGYVNFGQVVAATARGFNMGADLATVLCVFTILAAGDIATESFYLGAGPGNVGGLNRHSTSEADISPNREDYYLGCGDNHHLSSRLFKQNVGIVANSVSKQFDLTNMGSQYATSASFSRQNNPYLYFFPFPLIVSVAAYAFYPNFFSNGTFGAGGVANYESISSIIGAKYDDKTGEFQYVPEKWPENWYRRATPYGAAQALSQGLATIYTRNIVVPGFAQVGSPNLNPQTILCDFYQGINSITPLFFAGSAQQAAAAATWALSKFDPYFTNTTLGCPSGTLSPNFYPNPRNQGGPLNPGPGAKNGNNVYGQTYFTSAPTKPQC